MPRKEVTVSFKVVSNIIGVTEVQEDCDNKRGRTTTYIATYPVRGAQQLF